MKKRKHNTYCEVTVNFPASPDVTYHFCVDGGSEDKAVKIAKKLFSDRGTYSGRAVCKEKKA